MNIIKNVFGGWELKEWVSKHVVAAIATGIFTLLSKWLAPDIAQAITDHVREIAIIGVGVISTLDWFTFRSSKK